MAKRSDDEIRGWFIGQMPDGWFESIEIQGDRDEIMVFGTLSASKIDENASEETRQSAGLGRIDRFREDTRGQRMRIAQDAERRFGQKVSWGAVCGDVRKPFTTFSVPVMTRLRMQERAVLDTLIDSGIARSRSEALAWCVRLVNQHQADWLQELRDAMTRVEEVRAKGPKADA